MKITNELIRAASHCHRCGSRLFLPGGFTISVGQMPRKLCSACEKILKDFNNPSMKTYREVCQRVATGT